MNRLNQFLVVIIFTIILFGCQPKKKKTENFQEYFTEVEKKQDKLIEAENLCQPLEDKLEDIKKKYREEMELPDDDNILYPPNVKMIEADISCCTKNDEAPCNMCEKDGEEKYGNDCHCKSGLCEAK